MFFVKVEVEAKDSRYMSFEGVANMYSNVLEEETQTMERSTWLQRKSRCVPAEEAAFRNVLKVRWENMACPEKLQMEDVRPVVIGSTEKGKCKNGQERQEKKKNEILVHRWYKDNGTFVFSSLTLKHKSEKKMGKHIKLPKNMIGSTRAPWPREGGRKNDGTIFKNKKTKRIPNYGTVPFGSMRRTRR